jgi:Helix-turn-helix domain
METIRMSRQERRRLEMMSQVKSGALTLAKGGQLLGLSYRQAKRVRARYEAEGDEGLVHRLRGRPSNRLGAAAFRDQVLARYVERYGDYGPTLAAESLAAEGLLVPAQTLRRWLLDAGLWARHRRRKLHRRRRPRREHPGELLQMDGSHHDWFEGRRPEAVLMVMIDDATGRIYARFFEEETLAAAFETFERYATQYGVPQALYVDRFSIYRSDREPTAAEILAGKEPQTQFGRAMQELDVRLILARSPQAKGRVERMNGTLQDRLVKALRQRGLSDLATANRYLEEEFLAPFNAKFTVPPAQATDVHRPLEPRQELARILSVCEERVVHNDWTIRWHNRFLQLSSGNAVEPGQSVLVYEQRDGQVRAFIGERELAWGTLPENPPKPRPPQPRAIRSSQGNRPAADHPWRKQVLSASDPSGDVGAGLLRSGSLALASTSQAGPHVLLQTEPPKPMGHF